MSELISYKCPNCGGDLRYMPEKGDYGCAYCDSHFDLAALEKLYESQGASSDAAGAEAEKEQSAAESGEMLQYSCPSCGAEIVTDESTAATFCYYCHNPVVLSGRLGGAYRPDYVVPFAIERKRALEIFDSWIRQKKFVPRAFYNKQQIEKFSGVYFPYLLYSCEVSGSIDVNARRIERSRAGDYENITTSTYHIRREGTLPVNSVAKNALKKANSVLVEGVQPFNTEGLKPFHMSYLSGFLAERKDTEPEELAQAVEQEVRSYALSRLKSSISGYEDVTVSGDNLKLSRAEWKYALMPVWTMTYKDPGSDKLYYFSLNGQSGKVIGELPVDRKALALYFLQIFVPLLAALLALSYFFL